MYGGSDGLADADGLTDADGLILAEGTFLDGEGDSDPDFLCS